MAGEATTAFGVTNLRGAMSQGITAVTDMFLDGGIELTEEQHQIIKTQMFPNGEPNPAFDVGEFWKDTFGKAREASKGIDFMMLLSNPLGVAAQITSSLLNLGGIGETILGFLKDIPIVGEFFGKASKASTEGDQSGQPKSYIDKSLPPVVQVSEVEQAPEQNRTEELPKVGLDGRDITGEQKRVAGQPATDTDAPVVDKALTSEPLV